MLRTKRFFSYKLTDMNGIFVIAVPFNFFVPFPSHMSKSHSDLSTKIIFNDPQTDNQLVHLQLCRKPRTGKPNLITQSGQSFVFSNTYTNTSNGPLFYT